MVRENARTAQDQLEFSNKYEALTKQYEEQKNSLDKAAKEKAYNLCFDLKAEKCSIKVSGYHELEIIQVNGESIK